MPEPTAEQLRGALLGMAIGDALGLPFEGLKPARQKRLYPQIKGYHFIFGQGMVSDDTEHACLTAQALLLHPNSAAGFRRCLAWELRWWFLGLPAGLGLATLRGCLRLWLGIPPERSGVWSAGNGPAMRVVILGVALGHNPAKLRAYVEASSLMTHRDPKALDGALAIALAAWQAAQGIQNPQAYLEALRSPELGLNPESDCFKLLEASLERLELSSQEFMRWLGCEQGITGYMLHTVPAVIWFWQRDPRDFGETLTEAVRCGGDTDTVAAILGGILGAGLGAQALPLALLNPLIEWPRSVFWMSEMGTRLALALQGLPQPRLKINPLALVLRNLFFLVIVLLHGFRRLLPPY